MILLGLGLYAPRATYALVTWVAVDAGRLAEQYHVSALLFLVAIALGAISLGLLILTVLPVLERLNKAVFNRMKKHPRKATALTRLRDATGMGLETRRRDSYLLRQRAPLLAPFPEPPCASYASPKCRRIVLVL